MAKKKENSSTSNLVIVESPAKAKTIENYLGTGFHVLSSYGHVRDLPKKGIAIDIENNFAPSYEISPDKKQLVSALKKEVDKADVVWLATDEDREGEAISWHLYEALNLKNKQTRRITFNEITKNAILKAIDNPRDINIELVNAQQARRVLDRLVGFELSPVLWRKVRPSLSAGRVQSVAVKLIVDREREIEAFNIGSFFRINGFFKAINGKLKTELEIQLEDKQQTQQFLTSCQNAQFSVADVQTKPATKKPSAPFTTSTLQQEASLKLGFSVSRTMSVAQRLYESGFITYMRTDSVNLSQTAIEAAQKEVVKSYGNNYSQPTTYKTKSEGAQEAHEAIRPTDFAKHSINVSRDEDRLYDLIWKRAIASQMSPAQLERTTVSIKARNVKHAFIAKGEVIKFDGFLRIYIESSIDEDEEVEKEGLLPQVEVNELVDMERIIATQRFSRPPARYVEASLVKKLEELGIGRPSTYAPTISTIQKRGYVEKRENEGKERTFTVIELAKNGISESTKTEITGKDKNKLLPTDIGIVVTDFLEQHFSQIMDYHFTAEVEKKFDEIAQGLTEWNKMIREFYKPFHTEVANTLEHSERVTGERILGEHPENKKKVIARIGRFGPMVQIGNEQEDGEKPQFASLRANQSISTITLQEAIELFKLPRTLGKYQELELKANFGRFGPYVQHGKIFATIPKGEDPMTISYDRAVEILKEKLEKDANKIIKIFPEDENVQLLNGRWGAYLKIGKNNYKLPKDIDATTLTYKECLTISENQEKTTTKSTKNRKTTTKKTVK